MGLGRTIMNPFPLDDPNGRNRGDSPRSLAVSHSRRRDSGPARSSEPRPPERAPGLTALALQLAFDSLLEPAPAGHRGATAGERHLVYMCRDYAVDVHLEGRDHGGPLVRGELLSRSAGPVAEIPAFLVAGDQITGYDRTGALGEFCLEGAAQTEVRLCLLLDAEHCIDLPLRLAGPAAECGA